MLFQLQAWIVFNDQKESLTRFPQIIAFCMTKCVISLTPQKLYFDDVGPELSRIGQIRTFVAVIWQRVMNKIWQNVAERIQLDSASR